MPSQTKFFFLLMILFQSIIVRSEEIMLINNSILQVDVIKIKNHILYAKDSVLGKIEIPVNKIHSIKLNKSYWVKMTNNEKFYYIDTKKNKNFARKLAQKGGGNPLCSITELQSMATSGKQVKDISAYALAPVSTPILDSDSSGTITRDDLKRANTIDQKNNWLVANKLSGYIDFDKIGNANERSTTLTLSGSTQFRNLKNRNTIAWSLAHKKDSSDSRDERALSYKYNYFIGKKIYLFSDLAYGYDTEDNPYQTTNINTGIGYQLFDNDKISLQFEVGPGYTFQNFKPGDEVRSPAFYTGIIYNHKITTTLSLFNSTSLNFTKTKSSLVISGKCGLKYDITQKLWLELAHNYNWTKDPEPGLKPYDGNMKFGLGIGW